MPRHRGRARFRCSILLEGRDDEVLDCRGEAVFSIEGESTGGRRRDRVDRLDYAGNHSQHAASWRASDQLLCIVPAKGDPVCHAQIAIGGSMILLRGLATRATNTPFVITGGTGRFKDVTGSLVERQPRPKLG